jgi:hypothetical protein
MASSRFPVAGITLGRVVRVFLSDVRAHKAPLAVYVVSVRSEVVKRHDGQSLRTGTRVCEQTARSMLRFSLLDCNCCGLASTPWRCKSAASRPGQQSRKTSTAHRTPTGTRAKKYMRQMEVLGHSQRTLMYRGHCTRRSMSRKRAEAHLLSEAKNGVGTCIESEGCCYQTACGIHPEQASAKQARVERWPSDDTHDTRSDAVVKGPSFKALSALQMPK